MLAKLKKRTRHREMVCPHLLKDKDRQERRSARPLWTLATAKQPLSSEEKRNLQWDNLQKKIKKTKQSQKQKLL